MGMPYVGLSPYGAINIIKCQLLANDKGLTARCGLDEAGAAEVGIVKEKCAKYLLAAQFITSHSRLENTVDFLD